VVPLFPDVPRLFTFLFCRIFLPACLGANLELLLHWFHFFTDILGFVFKLGFTPSIDKHISLIGTLRSFTVRI
jgi:hypothetical protein